MRLSEFLRASFDEIEREWEEFAKTLAPVAADMDNSALRDHLPEIVDAIAAEIEASTEPQLHKFERMSEENLARISARHAAMRINSGFDLEQIIAEYGAFRATVARLWSETLPDQRESNLSELIRFNACIDQAVAHLVQRYARDSTKYGDRFTSILVHDVRSPLNLINVAGYALLDEGSLSEAQVSNVSRIFRGVRRIDRLLNDLAVVVRSRVGTPLPLAKSKSDLGVICEQAVEEVKASHPDVVVEIHRDGNLIGEWDGERLAQVVSNLVVNAIIHASAKKVNVLLQDAGPLSVVLKVCNQGSPIPAELQQSIFEPFVHSSDSSEDLSRGFGLGLFIVRQIVAAHGGKVHVTSSQSEGTIFTVQLPRSS
jgi:signal transduction histidine kinase